MVSVVPGISNGTKYQSGCESQQAAFPNPRFTCPMQGTVNLILLQGSFQLDFVQRVVLVFGINQDGGHACHMHHHPFAPVYSYMYSSSFSGLYGHRGH